MTIGKLIKLCLIGLSIDVIFIKLIVSYPIIYIVLVFHSFLLSKIGFTYRKYRSHFSGYAIKRNVSQNIMDVIYFMTMFMPIINTIISSIYYFRSFAPDEIYKKYTYDKLVPFRQAVVEYDPNEKNDFPIIQEVSDEDELVSYYCNLTEKEYELSKKMVAAEDYVDYIIMNKNLSKEKKEQLLKLYRTKILLKKKIKVDEKVKKLIK